MPSSRPRQDAACPRRRRQLVVAMVVALLAGVVVGVAPAQGQSYTIYVAPNGDDSNPGTRARPKATLQAAMLELPTGGDIIMRGGNYYITGGSSALYQGGTARRPLVVKSAKGERASLTSAPGNHCVLALADYTRIRNLDCTGSSGIMAFGADHVIIYGNYVHDLTADRVQGINVSGGPSNIVVRKNTVRRVPHSGIVVGDTRFGSARNIVIDDNVVRQANYQFRHTPPWQGGWGGGIGAVGADNVRITDNDVRRTYGEGINCPLSNNCRVRRNVVVDAWNALFYADNTTNSVWEDNVAKTTGDQRFTRDYGAGAFVAGGFAFGNESGWYEGPGNPTAGNVVRNNVVIDAFHGVSFGDFGASSGMNTTRIANNTFVRVTCGTAFEANSRNHSNEFMNNIVVVNDNGYAACQSTSGVRYRNNLWSNVNPGAAGHSSDVRGNPGFTRGTGRKASSYRLAAGSRAIDEGRTLDYVSDDKRKRDRPRGGAFDIGAFEY